MVLNLMDEVIIDNEYYYVAKVTKDYIVFSSFETSKVVKIAISKTKIKEG